MSVGVSSHLEEKARLLKSKHQTEGSKGVWSVLAISLLTETSTAPLAKSFFFFVFFLGSFLVFVVFNSISYLCLCRVTFYLYWQRLKRKANCIRIEIRQYCSLFALIWIRSSCYFFFIIYKNVLFWLLVKTHCKLPSLEYFSFSFSISWRSHNCLCCWWNWKYSTLSWRFDIHFSFCYSQTIMPDGAILHLIVPKCYSSVSFLC